MKILIIDADEAERAAAMRALTRAQLETRVSVCGSSADALTALQNEAFDCAILDFHLPDGDAPTVIKRARESGILTPIIVLTGRNDDVAAVEATRAAAIDYLAKGRLSTGDLVRSVRAAVRLQAAESQREQAEKARNESEDRFRVMADSAPVLILMTEPDGKLSFVNQGWLDFTGRLLSHEVGHAWEEGIFASDLPKTLETFRAANTTRSAYALEFRLRRHDGEYRWMLCSGVPRFLAHGEFAGHIASCVDITERKVTEETLVRNQVHIAALNKDLRRTMSTMHDRVRNTLQILAAMVDLMTVRGDDMVPAEDVRQLGTHIHIMAMVQDLLMHQARTDGQANYLSARAVLDRLLPLLDSAESSSRLQTEVEDIRLPAQQGIALPIVVNELVSNAFRHGARPGGTVHLTLHRIDTSAQLTVSDDGPGFPPGFDPHRSSHMGLELVDRLSKWDLLGDTRYANRPEGGAIVTVTIPLPGINATDG